MTMTMIRSVLIALSSVITGCAMLQRLEVAPVAKSVEPPGNVALYVAVSQGKQPVTDLTAQNFRIFEDGQLISAEQSRQQLLPRDAVALHRTLLLVDVSGAADPALRRQLARGAAAFVERVRRNQHVSVLGFDGRAELIPIGEYPRGQQGPDELAELSNVQVADPSRNLHGAVVKALGELDARLMTEKKPVRVGSLVVYTDGADLAGRWSYEGMREVVDKSGHRVFAIGLRQGEKGFSLDDLGRAGAVRAESPTSAAIAFEEMASRVDAAYHGFYLLAYCSPARDGRRLLKIEITREDAEGNQHTGTLHDELEAAGFGPGCDPARTPGFGVAPPPAESESAPATEPEPAPPTAGE
jgi:hypothetical protein